MFNIKAVILDIKQSIKLTINLRGLKFNFIFNRSVYLPLLSSVLLGFFCRNGLHAVYSILQYQCGTRIACNKAENWTWIQSYIIQREARPFQVHGNHDICFRCLYCVFNTISGKLRSRFLLRYLFPNFFNLFVANVSSDQNYENSILSLLTRVVRKFCGQHEYFPY